MGLIQTRGWVLRHYDFGETSRIVVFLTETAGKLKGMVKGARPRQGRGAGLLEPLTLVELTCYRKAGRELDLVRACDPVPGQPRLPADLEALAIRSYFAELVDRFFQEGDPIPAGFRLLGETAQALAAGAPVPALARYVEYWLLRLQGVYPDHRRCPGCGAEPSDRLRFHRETGQFVCRACAGRGARPLPPETGAFLTFCAGQPPTALAASPGPPAVWARLEGVHRHLVETFLGTGLKSYRVLAQLAQAPS